MCRQLGVARSSFYAWRARAGTITATQARREALKPEIQRVFTFLRGVGGCRRVAAKLNDEGIVCSVGLVADLMREMGLQGIVRGKTMRTTISDKAAPCPLDRVNREFIRDLQHAWGQADPRGRMLRLDVRSLIEPEVLALARPLPAVRNAEADPVREDVELPAAWAEHAPFAEEPHDLDPQTISDNRDDWIRAWTEIVVG